MLVNRYRQRHLTNPVVKIIILISYFFRDNTPIDGFSTKNHGEGGSEQVRFRPFLQNELPDMPVEQFLAYLRFEQREKLDQLGIEMGTFD